MKKRARRTGNFFRSSNQKKHINRQNHTRTQLRQQQIVQIASANSAIETSKKCNRPSKTMHNTRSSVLKYCMVEIRRKLPCFKPLCVCIYSTNPDKGGKKKSDTRTNKTSGILQTRQSEGRDLQLLHLGQITE